MAYIADEVKIYEALKERLKTDDPDIDDITLNDTLEGATDLRERLVSICQAIEEKNLTAEVLAQRIKDMTARKKRFETSAEHLRNLVLWAMVEAEIPKLQAPELTASVGKGSTSVIITDDTLIPPHLMEYTAKPVKSEIKKELEDGHTVPGASLSNSGPRLTIRTK